jgi:hypothetical protein
MAIIIKQKPAYPTFPVGQEVIFSVYNHSIVTTKTNVKYIAQVYIDKNPIVPNTGAGFVGEFKTTPNGAGYGMFDLSSIVESYVNADNMANISSNYKGVFIGTSNPTPLHLVDEYSRNQNIIRYLRVVFRTEYLDGSQTPPVVIRASDFDVTDEMKIWNGYLKETDAINTFSGNFGYRPDRFFLNKLVSEGDTAAKWLTNAPDDRYALPTDYGVASLMSFPYEGAELHHIKLTYFKNNGQQVSEEVDNVYNKGGMGPYQSNSDWNILHFGCYPANIYNWSSTFKALIDDNNITKYIVVGQNVDDVQVTFAFTVNILCPNQKGYEPIRLTWLNQWGTWDYYTFNMKSSKSISTKGSTYEQLGGTWNESTYKPNSYKGGKKSFRVNATEKVIMNTDFVNESESEWFEELINSPEIYILNGFKTDSVGSALTTYVIPVRLNTSSYTRKTVANDKLMQYTFEVEKSKTLRTQAV